LESLTIDLTLDGKPTFKSAQDILYSIAESHFGRHSWKVRLNNEQSTDEDYINLGFVLKKKITKEPKLYVVLNNMELDKDEGLIYSESAIETFIDWMVLTNAKFTLVTPHLPDKRWYKLLMDLRAPSKECSDPMCLNLLYKDKDWDVMFARFDHTIWSIDSSKYST
jgi:hypothetical protein